MLTERRGTGILRCLLTLDSLRGLRLGLTAKAIAHELQQRTGRLWHPRTCERDARILIHAGLVERNGQRFRLVPRHPLLATIGGAA